MNTSWFDPQGLWFLILIGGVTFWCAICRMISLAGWSQLAQSFRAGNVAIGPLQSFQSMDVGGARYNGAIVARVWGAGLYLRVWPIFRVGHPPLLIPWSAIGPLQEQKMWWSQVWICTVTAGRCGRVKLSIGQRALAEAISMHITNQSEAMTP